MKYTKEYLRKNKVAVNCKDLYEFLEFHKRIGIYNPVEFISYDKKTCVSIYERESTTGFDKESYWLNDGYAIISFEDFLEDRKENEKETLTLTGDEKRRYEIQKKIEKIPGNVWNNIYQMYIIAPDEWLLPIVEEIGREELKWFFNIKIKEKKTMVMKEAIEKGEEFNFMGYKFIFDKMTKTELMYKRVGWPDYLIYPANSIIQHQNELVEV